MKSAESENLNEQGTNYDGDAYAHAVNTVDIGVVKVSNNSIEILLVKRKNPPFRDMWVLPGGFLDIDKKETLEEAALRELLEETGVSKLKVRQLKTYDGPNRDPRHRVISTAFFTVINESTFKKLSIKAGSDAKEYKWFPLNKVPKLGFDHNLIVNDVKTTIQEILVSTPIAFEFVEKSFTWSDLQNVYKIVLNKPMIPSNFRRKISSMYEIISVESDKKDKSVGRPSKLLKYKGIKKNF
jgi:8-oxo-dGTP diphosphatase